MVVISLVRKMVVHPDDHDNHARFVVVSRGNQETTATGISSFCQGGTIARGPRCMRGFRWLVFVRFVLRAPESRLVSVFRAWMVLDSA